MALKPGHHERAEDDENHQEGFQRWVAGIDLRDAAASTQPRTIKTVQVPDWLESVLRKCNQVREICITLPNVPESLKLSRQA